MASKCRICGRPDRVMHRTDPLLCAECSQEIEREVARRAAMEQRLEACETALYNCQQDAAAVFRLLLDHERDLFGEWVLAETNDPVKFAELERVQKLVAKARLHQPEFDALLCG